MDPKKEQRVRIQLCANLGKRATETLAVIRQAFLEERISMLGSGQIEKKGEAGKEKSQEHAHHFP
jgi:hypothetical protein